MELSGQIALVTGASRGIGRAIAARLVEQGAKVIGTATGDRGVTVIDQRLSGHGKGMPLEITNQGSIEQLISKINSQWGEVSILVNNAGVCQDNLLLRLSLEAWEQVLSVNLTGVFRLTKAVLGSMVKRRYGRIINIGSVVGSSGNAGQTNYAAAKAGLIGYSKSLAQEVARRGITVNVVSPGFIDTDMAQALSEARQQQIVSQIPLGRLGTAEEVAYLVAFLASPQAAYITGETIQVNGGLHMV
ncbi:MAG: 3-oxoacyl-ACP reductase FabG [Candidatus Symbiodolus clandestinus]